MEQIYTVLSSQILFSKSRQQTFQGKHACVGPAGKLQKLG